MKFDGSAVDFGDKQYTITAVDGQSQGQSPASSLYLIDDSLTAIPSREAFKRLMVVQRHINMPATGDMEPIVPEVSYNSKKKHKMNDATEKRKTKKQK